MNAYETKQTVINILENDASIRQWYESEHGFSLDKAKETDSSLYTTFGTSGFGDIAGSIIEDGEKLNG